VSESTDMPPRRGWTQRIASLHPVLRGSAIGLVALLLVGGIGLWMLSRQLPGLIEQRLNAGVKGYRFSVAQAWLTPSLALEIRDLTMIQIDHPDPPVAQIPHWTLSIQWSELLHGVLVSDYVIERPTLHITLPQARKEIQDEVPIQRKGWRDAVYSFYPIKINEFRVFDADITYVDQDSEHPLHFTQLDLVAGNVRNIRSPDDSYPSDIGLTGNIFDTGRVTLRGRANFLAQPHVGFDADIDLTEVPLEPLLSVAGRYNVRLRGGVLSADGRLEYTAQGQTDATLRNLAIQNARIDYVHTPETSAREAQVRRAAARTAKELQNEPRTRIRVEHAEVTRSELGFVNRAADPPYRMFLDEAQLRIENFSNQMREGASKLTLTGKFMGSGRTVVSGTMRPEGRSPDFDLDVKIEDAHLPAMNDVLRAYGKIDVTAGVFSLYSELHVQNGRIAGYVKPLFKDVDVYDPEQDRKKNVLWQAYEGVVGGLAKLLENGPRDEVATQTDLSGPLENPSTSIGQTVLNLIRNGFFNAILPGFDREMESREKRR